MRIVAQWILLGDPDYVQLEQLAIEDSESNVAVDLQSDQNGVTSEDSDSNYDTDYDTDLKEEPTIQSQVEAAQNLTIEQENEENSECNEPTPSDDENPIEHMQQEKEQDCEDNTPLLDNRGRYSRSFDPPIQAPQVSYMADISIKERYLHAKKNFLNPTPPSNLAKYRMLDRNWILANYLALDTPALQDTPSWIGYNSLIYSDYKYLHRIAYLQSLNASPTKNEIVQQTLDLTLEIQKEVGQSYIEVTYDLAIAMKAYRIKSAYPEKYSSIFINLGVFHVEMDYFHAVGKFLDESGFSKIMVESEVIASGSVFGFISGKHYNRCKRLHPLMYVSLHKLLLERFCNERNKNLSKKSIESLINHRRTRTFDDPEPCFDPDIYDFLEKYANFEQECYEGIHGKTAQYYAIYMRLIDYWVDLSRSIRMGDFKLLKFSSIKISNIFFALNQQNYARWLAKYVDALMRGNKTHPGLINNLKNNSHCVRRSNRPFSSRPFDYVMETTQNARAASHMTGVMNIKHDFNCRQRWSITHGARTAINTHMYDMLDLKKRKIYVMNSRQVIRIEIMNKARESYELLKIILTHFLQICKKINFSIYPPDGLFLTR